MWTEYFHTRIFSHICTLTFCAHAFPWLKVLQHVSLQKERSSTGHHVSDPSLSLHPLISSTLSSVSTCFPISSLLLFCSTSMWSEPPSTRTLAHTQNESMALWRYKTLLHTRVSILQNRHGCAKPGLSVCSRIVRLTNNQTKCQRKATILTKEEKATTRMLRLPPKIAPQLGRVSQDSEALVSQRGRQPPGTPDAKSWERFEEYDSLSLRYVKQVSGNRTDYRLEI